MKAPKVGDEWQRASLIFAYFRPVLIARLLRLGAEGIGRANKAAWLFDFSAPHPSLPPTRDQLRLRLAPVLAQSVLLCTDLLR